MYLKKFFLKPMGVLCFLAFVACEDNSITSEIENVEDDILYESDELGGMSRKASVAEIEARADEQYQKSMNLRKNRVTAATSMPHWVGVLSASGGCPSGVPNISYYMDCEDNKNDTKFFNPECTDCYRPKGAQIVGNGNVQWSICIVDAKKYNFQKTEYAYAIFDFSLEQYLGKKNIKSVYVFNDDEDNDNKNDYGNSSCGFVRRASGQLPIIKDSRNTEFWLLYFDADDNSSYKLPNIGFDYDIFSNFNCDYKNEAILIVDSEDKKCCNSVITYYPATETQAAHKEGKLDTWVDSKYKIIKNSGSHMHFAIQKSSVHRNVR